MAPFSAILALQELLVRIWTMENIFFEFLTLFLLHMQNFTWIRNDSFFSILAPYKLLMRIWTHGPLEFIACLDVLYWLSKYFAFWLQSIWEIDPTHLIFLRLFYYSGCPNHTPRIFRILTVVKMRKIVSPSQLA